MAANNDYPTISEASPYVILQSATYQSETIVDCQEVVLTMRPAGTLEKFLKNGWKLVTIAWVRDENTNYGQAPAVRHVLRAVIVKTEKK